MTIPLISPAKINRTLSLQNFSSLHQKHELQSIMQKISLHDTLEIEESSEFSGIQLTVTGKFREGVPYDEKNIIVQAYQFFLKEYKNILPQKKIGYKILLTKNIPNQAGLGGGSSNAAIFIRYLHAKYNIPLFSGKYVNLGSDIPFFLEPFSIGLLSGVGEKIKKFQYNENIPFYKYGVLLFPNDTKISTKWAFQNFRKYRDQKKNKKKHTHNKTPFKNDFTPFLQESIPEISQILAIISEISKTEDVAEYDISGSGSSIFVLFTRAEYQQNFLEEIQKKYPILCTAEKFFCEEYKN